MEETITIKVNKRNLKIWDIILAALSSAFIFVAFVLSLSVYLHEAVEGDDGQYLLIFWKNAAVYMAFAIAAFLCLAIRFFVCVLPSYKSAKSPANTAMIVINIITMILMILTCVSIVMYDANDWPADPTTAVSIATSCQTASIVCSSLTVLPSAILSAFSFKEMKN